MKFGKEIQSKQIPGWSQYYLDYKSLKKIVSSLYKNRGLNIDIDVLPRSDKRASKDERRLWHSASVEIVTDGPALVGLLGNDDERGPEYQRCKAFFFFKLERELDKINSFYLQKEAELKLRLDTLLSKRREAALHYMPVGTPDTPVHDHWEWRAVEEGFQVLRRDLDKLQEFVEINATGFRKILKKWDKRSKSTTKELYLARQIEVQPVFDRKMIAELVDIVAGCLLDLTHVPLEVDTGVLGANERIMNRRMALEVSGQLHAFKDLESALQRSISTKNEEGLRQSIAEADRLSKSLTGKTHVTRILWKATIDAQPDLADIIMESPPFDFAFVDDINGRTCLHLTTIAGKSRLLDLCLQHTVQISRQDVYGRTALHYATMHGHAEICRRLLSCGLSPSTLDLDNYTPLHYAILNGCIDCVLVILAVSAHTWQSTSEVNALTLACQVGWRDVVVKLLECGAQSEPNSNGEYPIHFAAREGWEGICKLLLAHPGFDLPDKYNEWTPLFHAVRFGRASCVDVLLEAGANTKVVDESGRTPAFYAAWYGHTNILNRLVSIGNGPLLGTSPDFPKSPPSEITFSAEEELDMIPSLSLPPPIMPFRVYGHNYLTGTHLIQICLGHPSISSLDVPPVTLLPQITGDLKDQYPGVSPAMKLVVTCISDVVTAPFALQLPIEDEERNVVFQLAKLEDFFLEFSLYPSLGSKIIGRSILLPSAFQGIKFRGRYVAPLMDQYFHVIGEVAFEVCVISPLSSHNLVTGGGIETYWKSAATPFGQPVQRPVRPLPRSSHLNIHRSSPISRRTLPTHTDSAITSSSLDGIYIRITIQVTRDLVPVVYSKLHLSSGLLSVGLADVTLPQFLAIGGDITLPGVGSSIDAWLTHVMNSCLTLETLLRKLPPEIGLFMDVVCLTTSMKDSLQIGHSHKLNVAVDTILQTVYAEADVTNQLADHGARRKIVFSSFHPDVCSALNWKQPNYPVMFSSCCGLSNSHLPNFSFNFPENDPRRGSINAAISFAKANNLLGLVVPTELLVQVPPLVSGIKDAGLMVTAFGTGDCQKALEDQMMSSGNRVDGLLEAGLVMYTDIS